MKSVPAVIIALVVVAAAGAPGRRIGHHGADR